MDFINWLSNVFTNILSLLQNSYICGYNIFDIIFSIALVSILINLFFKND